MTTKKKVNNIIAFISAIFCGFKHFDISLRTAGIAGSRALCKHTFRIIVVIIDIDIFFRYLVYI